MIAPVETVIFVARIVEVILSMLHMPPLLTVISPVNVLVAAFVSSSVPETEVAPETVKVHVEVAPVLKTAPAFTVKFETVVIPVAVFVPLPDIVRLEYVVAFTVCAPALV